MAEEQHKCPYHDRMGNLVDRCEQGVADRGKAYWDGINSKLEKKLFFWVTGIAFSIWSLSAAFLVGISLFLYSSTSKQIDVIHTQLVIVQTTVKDISNDLSYLKGASTKENRNGNDFKPPN